MTRSEALLSEVRYELDRRRAVLDRTCDLHTVTITVKFDAGTEQVRGVSWHEERLARRTPRGT